jgi:hypothetical protein
MAIDIVAARRAIGLPQVVDSLRIALVVGTILNLINQGDALLALGPFDWGKCVLTYFVPFAVATYSAYRAYRALNLMQGKP